MAVTAELKKMKEHCVQLDGSLTKLNGLFKNIHKTATKRFKAEIERCIELQTNPVVEKVERKRDLKAKRKNPFLKLSSLQGEAEVDDLQCSTCRRIFTRARNLKWHR